MSLQLLANICIFILILLAFFLLVPRHWSLGRKTFLGLIIGSVLGSLLRWKYQLNPLILEETSAWFSVVGIGYLQLFKMILMPLVFISILSAVGQLRSLTDLGKMSSLTIAFLLVTTAISAIVGSLTTYFAHLTSAGLELTEQAVKNLDNLGGRLDSLANLSLPSLLLSFFPHNLFQDLSGAFATSVISVVFAAVFFGVAALKVCQDQPEAGQKILDLINLLQIWIMKVVRLVISFTPYGVLALIANMMLSSNLGSLLNLVYFLVVGYIALFIVFIIHLVIVMLLGLSPNRYLKKVLPLLSFAFTSRSSSAAIPLNIEVQTNKLGVSRPVAGFAASFGTVIGQNGCAGVYPAILVTMIAPSLGINVLDPQFFFWMVFVIVLSSFGVAGVGGGAIFASLIVLPMLGMPISLVAILMAVDPLIDMGRTALNINASVISGLFTSNVVKDFDKETFLAEEPMDG